MAGPGAMTLLENDIFGKGLEAEEEEKKFAELNLSISSFNNIRFMKNNASEKVGNIKGNRGEDYKTSEVDV